MDFRLTPEQEAFRQEVSAVLAEALPPGRFIEEAAQSPGQKVLLDQFLAALAERRWLAIGWPEEYGGGGRSVIEQAIFNEQMGYHHAPDEALVPVTIIGPAILHFGLPEVKAYHLPRIARGEGVYWQVFTEPMSGSDLASLQTRATRDGDNFVLNGQKVFVGDGRPPDYLYVAARTNPELARHRGISIFIVDAKTPGITISHLKPLAGWMKNQIYFDDARIPGSALMGQINNGWSHMRDTLSVERSGISKAAECKRIVEDLIEACRHLTRDGIPLLQHTEIQHLLANLLIEIEAWQLLCWRIVWLQHTNQPINAEASVVAVHRKSFFPRLAEAISDIVGPYSFLKPGSPWALMLGKLEYWQRDAIHTHGGGTPEIQRNVIALRGLGLPR